jgi:AcrR family transcriptional regulator
MARMVNEKEFAARRSQILDVAQQLIYTKGYVQMSIQDILDALKMSKGAFYHYFESKPALMEALCDRMFDEAQVLILPIADDPKLTAIEKFVLYFNTSARWKIARKDFLIELLRIWYHDNNLIIREKVTRGGITMVVPMFSRMIQQGIVEGSFKTDYPEQMAEVVMSLMLSLGDSLSMQILKSEHVRDQQERQELVDTVNKLALAYKQALERVLGCIPGTLNVLDVDTLKAWLITPDGVEE